MTFFHKITVTEKKFCKLIVMVNNHVNNHGCEYANKCMENSLLNFKMFGSQKHQINVDLLEW